MSIQKIINKFRKDLKKKKPLVGGWMQISNSNLVELMCSSPYEWIAFDMEHGSFSIRDLPDLFRATELKNKLSLVRLPNKNLEVCSQVLDAGCPGIIIPNIKHESELNSIIRSCKYPPIGTRGVGYSRANLFGKKFKKYQKQKNNIIIIAIIENTSSVKRLEKILSVKGLDAILIGPYDLSASMGITGKFKNKKFQSIVNKIKGTANKSKIPCGIHVIEPKRSELKKCIKQGYKFIPYCTDAILLNSALEKSFKK